MIPRIGTLLFRTWILVASTGYGQDKQTTCTRSILGYIRWGIAAAICAGKIIVYARCTSHLKFCIFCIAQN